MNGRGPSAGLQKVPQLTPELNRFIDGMGMYFENQGIPRIGGRILGLLMIAHGPLSAEDIASILSISRGSVSTNFRLLHGSGLVEKVTLRGDRTTYFVFSDSAMEQRIAVGVQSAVAFKRLVQRAVDALPQKDPARHHLDSSLEWSDVLIDSLDQALARWRARPAAPATQPAAKGA
jgi:DNA-binding transcriptional regulator GbsR (MarR family)